MKRNVYLLLGLFLLCSLIAVGQSNPAYFYYYKNKKVPLSLHTEYVYLVMKPGVTSKAQLALYLGQNPEITKFSQSKVGQTLRTENSTAAQSSEYWAEVKLDSRLPYNEQVNQLKNNPAVALVAPYFKNETEEKIGLSNYFYVKLRNEYDLNLLLETAESTRTEIVGQNRFMPLWYTLKCNGNSYYNALQAANFFYKSGHFASAEPDLMTDLLADNNSGNINTTKANNYGVEELFLVPNDPLYANQWGLNNTGQNGGAAGIDINAEDAWDITTSNSGIIVAVLDHGFEMNHPDLTANTFGTGFDAQTGTAPSFVWGDHGTACAGIVGAVQNNALGVSGVAPNTSLMSISSNLGGTATIQVMADGINWAVQNGADIISNSWGGGTPSNIFDNAIDNALTNGRGGLGTIIVFSSGNNNGAVSYPANSNPDIIAVGAMSPCGERKNPGSCDGENWWGSNFGNELDVIAPGVLIPTTDRQGALGYVNGDYMNTFNGTSSACPHVAGVVALVLSVNSNLTVQEVNAIIEQSAQKVGGYNYQNTAGRPNGTWNNQMGYGLVDAYAAVLLAQGQGCQNDLIVNQDVPGGATDYREAVQTITATNIIFNNATAVYHAGQEITLQQGFHAQSGATFHAYNDGCTGVFQAKSQNQTTTGKIGNQQTPPTDSDTETVSNSKLVVFPNPFEGSVSFQFYTEQNAKVILSVYDLEGKLQLEYRLEYRQEGQQLIEAHLSTLSSGTYLYKLFVDKKPFSGKIIKK